MQKKKVGLIFSVLLVSFLCFCFNFGTASAAKSSTTLSYGMRGSSVQSLQSNLKTLGYFNSRATGYFGSVTLSSVKNLQRQYGLKVDGIVGSRTNSAIKDLLSRGSKTTTSRGDSTSREASTTQSNYLLPWYGTVQNIFSIGKTASIYDVETGLTFNIMRTYGGNHADCEPLTATDTAIYRKIYGYRSTWERRAIIVTVDGRKIAASMVGMPHAGLDSKPANTYVSNRSGGFGWGYNYDTIKGNNMDGHFCVHFLGSRTHGSGCVDSAHQSMIRKAASWAQRNGIR